jgi:hypothetical protein
VAHWIPRDPTFVSAGDARQVAGGALTKELKFLFGVHWSAQVRHGCQLRPSDPGYIHINRLECIVVLTQLAACIVALLLWKPATLTRSAATRSLKSPTS